MKQRGISRRRFVKNLPIAVVVAAGMLVPGKEGVTESSADVPVSREEFESSLTCLVRVERVERHDHTNFTNGVPWKGWEIQARCTAYDGFGKAFPLQLYYCFTAGRVGEEDESTRLLAIVRPGAVLVVSGCVAFSEGGTSTTIYGARLRESTV